jgi:hypothetical protein
MAELGKILYVLTKEVHNSSELRKKILRGTKIMEKYEKNIWAEIFYFARDLASNYLLYVLIF